MLGKALNYLRNCIINAKSFRELGVILLGSVLISYGARYFWMADLFSHFVMQYVIGGIIIFSILLILKDRKYIILPILALLLCLPKFSYYGHTVAFQEQEGQNSFSLLQFNKLVTNQNLVVIEKKIRNSNVDLVVLQEAGHKDKKIAKNLLDMFPHQILETRDHAFGMIVLSKTAFVSKKTIMIEDKVQENFALKIKLNPNNFTNDISIYALHAVPPMGHEAWTQRNNELEKVSKIISEDVSKNIVFAGDWNITPYSPFFKNTLKTSKLKMLRELPFTRPTWPAPFKIFGLNVFQIPIDHFLFSENLLPTNKEVGKAVESDHHPTIIEFIEKR